MCKFNGSMGGILFHLKSTHGLEPEMVGLILQELKYKYAFNNNSK